MAAGYWTRQENVGKKDPETGKFYGVVGIKYQFMANTADGTIPDLNVAAADLDDLPGADFVFGLESDFDGTTPPNNLTLVMKTQNGATQWSPTKHTADTFSKPDSPEPVTTGFLISATQDDAKTNSATGFITILVG